jgi:hypothetical protein
MSATIDPITRSVVQHRLSSIVAEMGEAMLRTSYSQILNSSRDFSLAVCDIKDRLIAQADHIPVHVGALPWATLAVEHRRCPTRRRHPAERSLSRRKPSAGPDGLCPDLRRWLDIRVGP